MATFATGKIDARWLRERLVSAAGTVQPLEGDLPGVRLSPAGLRPAAVLIPVVDHVTGLTVVLTRRTEHLNDHAGQISFPGGRAEPEDASPAETALREAHEEIGLAAEHVEVLGTLHQYCTVSGYCITPVVGLVKPPLELRPDTFEVAEIFEVPLAFFLDPANHRRGSLVRDGRRREFHAMPYGNYYIWGATAAILMNLYTVLTAG